MIIYGVMLRMMMNDDALTLKSCAMQCYMLTTTEWMMNDDE